MQNFIIKDWANNICFNGKTFDTFEDAWGFIYEKFPNGDVDGTYEDYFVEDTTSKDDHEYEYLNLSRQGIK